MSARTAAPRSEHHDLVLGIEDLLCTCCAETILETVRGLDGVSSARLDYQRAELRLTYDPSLIGEEARPYSRS